MYFHIVTNGAGANGNVPNRRIQAQVAVMNRAFSGQPAAGAADTPFRSSWRGSTGRRTTPGSPRSPAARQSAR
jgi:hypothetical protein